MKLFKSEFNDYRFRTVYIESNSEAKDCLEKIKHVPLYGIDIETAKLPEHVEHEKAGLCPHLSLIRLLQIYDGEIAWVFDLFKVDKDLLRTFLSDHRFVAHNALFEIQHLMHKGFPGLNIGCSMIMSQMVDAAEHSPFEPDEEEDEERGQTGLAAYRYRKHGLGDVVERLFGIRVSKTEQNSDWGAAELSTDQIVYAGLDALLTLKVTEKLSEKLVEYKMVKAYKLLKETQHVIAKIQLEGIPVDWEYHSKMIDEWKVKLNETDNYCRSFFGDTNLRSVPQMNAWLKEYLKDDPFTLMNWPKTKKGSFTFTKNKIFPYAHLPAIAALLEYKRWAKLVDTYGDSLLKQKHPVTNRVHTSYTLAVTRTGRLSSRGPNVQNFPRDQEFRNMFVAPEGYVLVVSDFSQIELRLQAEFSKDPVMCENYRKGEDIYCLMASKLFGRTVTKSKEDKPYRFTGKTVMLALGYGMGSTKLGDYAFNAGIRQSQEFWDAAWEAYYDLYSGYISWCHQVRKRSEILGYIETLFGKRRKLLKDELYTRAPNTVIQGSAAELMMQALLLCDKKLGDLGKIVATVHDEILIVCPEKNAEIVTKLLEESMNESMELLFPNAVSHHVADAAYGQRWGDVKSGL